MTNPPLNFSGFVKNLYSFWKILFVSSRYLKELASPLKGMVVYSCGNIWEKATMAKLARFNVNVTLQGSSR